MRGLMRTPKSRVPPATGWVVLIVVEGIYNCRWTPSRQIKLSPSLEQSWKSATLYAYRESGSIYQPVYLGERDDIPATDCTTEQLKYKAEPIAA